MMHSNNRSRFLLLCLAISLAFASAWIFLFPDDFGLGTSKNIRNFALRSSGPEMPPAGALPSLEDYAWPDRFPYGNSAARIKAELVPPAKISDKPFPPFTNTGNQECAFCSWRTRNLVPTESNEFATGSVAGKPRWRLPLKGKGHSTPFVVDHLVFLTQVEADKLFALAIDCQTGEIRWEKEIASGPFATTHSKGSVASSSATSNGELIFFAWSSSDTAFITALDMSGNPRWQKELGPCQITWGLSSSPLWCCGLIVMSIDNAEHGYTLALDDRNGDTVWCHHRPGNNIEGSYATPAVIPGSLAEPLIVIPGLGKVQALDARTGSLVWQIEGLGAVSGATPAISPELLIASSGYREKRLLAIRHSEGQLLKPAEREMQSTSRPPEGSDVAIEAGSQESSLAIAWSKDKESEVPYVPSPLFIGKDLFIVTDDGIVSSFRDDGSRRWRHRLQGGPVTASPILWNKSLVIACETGTITFMDPESGRVLQNLSLDSPVFATPTPFGTMLFIRASDSIHAIAAGE